MKPKIIVSFSGGRTSAFMAKTLLENERRERLSFVFANTGKENEQTLDFINRCDKEWGLELVWLEAKINPQMGIGTSYSIRSYETVSRNGEPFAEMIQKYGPPNQHYPHCTRELKEIPIKKWAKDNFGNNYLMAIGMRFDEPHRISHRAKEKRWIYPLYHDYPTTKKTVKDFWDKQPFDLDLLDYQGNCDLCWKKSQAKRIKILSESPEKGSWWKKWEDQEEHIFDRDGKSVESLMETARRKEAQLSIFEDKKTCACFSNVK